MSEDQEPYIADERDEYDMKAAFLAQEWAQDVQVLPVGTDLSGLRKAIAAAIREEIAAKDARIAELESALGEAEGLLCRLIELEVHPARGRHAQSIADKIRDLCHEQSGRAETKGSAQALPNDQSGDRELRVVVGGLIDWFSHGFCTQPFEIADYQAIMMDAGLMDDDYQLTARAKQLFEGGKLSSHQSGCDCHLHENQVCDICQGVSGDGEAR